jgi:hypothetical protein
MPLGGSALRAFGNAGDPGGACVTEGPGCAFEVEAVPEALSLGLGCLGPRKMKGVGLGFAGCMESTYVEVE